MQTLVLPPLTTLNEYINAERRNRYIAAKIKKTETETVAMIAKSKLQPMSKIIGISFYIYQTTRRKDADNYFIVSKWVMDGLVKARIIPNDTQRYTPYEWKWYFCDVDNNPRIEVELI